MASSRLTNIDLIKFISIIIMIVDHMVLISLRGTLSLGQLFFFSYVPLCQMGFLLSSGYLLAYRFDSQKTGKYLRRIILFIILFILMTWLTGEEIMASGSILLNFALSTLLGLVFLYWRQPKALLIFMGVLLGLDILLQVAGPQVSFLNAWLANYPYPVNSFSLYFFLGMILFFYQDQLRNIFQKKFMPWLIAGLLLFYSPIFLKNFYVNAYNSYQHLPWLLLTTSLIGVFFFFTWEKIKLPVVLDWPIKKTASALLYIYVLHYIIFFGYLADKNWSYAKLSLAILVIIIVAIVLKSLVDKCRQRLFRATIKQ